MESEAGAHGATYDIRNQLTATSGSATLLFRGTLDEAGAVAVNGKPARMLSDRVFEADVAVVPGENTVTVEAWDSAGNKKTDLFTLTQPAGSASFQYDANGNLTQKLEGSDTWNYEWDAENQLERVLKNGAEVARFLYDPLGRRVQKIAGGVSHEYVYDGQDILRESRSDGIVYTYAHGPGIDEPLARVSNTGPTVYYHADGLGSIIKMTDGRSGRHEAVRCVGEPRDRRWRSRPSPCPLRAAAWHRRLPCRPATAASPTAAAPPI